MGKPLTASEETMLLREVTRQAHEVLKDLRAAIREARRLGPSLVAEFEKLHYDEMAQLSNHMTEEGNRASAELNAAIDAARDLILSSLAARELTLDPKTGVIVLSFPPEKFDDQQPLPYPNHPPKETTP